MARTKNFAEVIKRKLKADPKLAAAVEREALGAEIATLVYQARHDAGLTQQELADRIGTRQSVIARLEDWDYSGHSLNMLKKVADAVGMKLHVELRPRVALKQNLTPRRKAARGSFRALATLRETSRL
jgi:ribosome-binding protein aMBF1 (putative translation factor)